MKILVCISNVPDTTTKVTFTDNNTQLITNGVQFILNSYDEIALAKAIELIEGDNGSVTVIHVGEINSEPTIRKALAIGATDAIRINTKPIDAWFVANQIAYYLKGNHYDLILTGSESIDFNGSKVTSMLGELLSIPSVSVIKKLTIEGNNAIVEREIEGGKEIISMPLPIIVGTSEGVAEPKIPTMRGIMSVRTKPLTVIEAVHLEVNTGIIEFEFPEQRGNVRLVNSDDLEELISLLHNEVKVI